MSRESLPPFALPALRSGSMPGVAWPALPDPQAAAILALLYQQEASQWLAPADLEKQQHVQLRELIQHAQQHTVFYRERGLSDRSLADIPLLTRRDLQSEEVNIKADRYPRAHGKAFQISTAGSTGQPVRIWRSQLSQLFWWASSLRDHLWHRRDFAATMAIIRVFHDKVDSQRPGQWGGRVFAGGEAWHLPIHTDVEQQLRWLQKINPDYLLTYPANLQSLLQAIHASGATLPKLREIRTISEVLPDALRQACQQQLGVKVVDLYSTNEVGIIALECPHSGLLHTQSENLIVEVVDAEGHPCAEGKVGQIVVTDLHNFAMPLIRYATGDYAERGPSCSCGRGLPTLRRVLGRHRNQALLPSGERIWAYPGGYGFQAVVPSLRQYQLIQEGPDHIRVRLVAEHALSGEQQHRLTEIIHTALGYPFHLHFECSAEPLKLGPSGKYEDFVSLV